MTRKRLRPWPGPLLAALALGGVVPLAVAAADLPLRTAIPDLAGRRLVVTVTTGEVRLQAWPQPGVEVEVVGEGRAAREAAALEAAVDETAETVTVRALQPADRKDADVRARVTVRLPAGAAVERVELFEGALVIEGVQGMVQAKVDRGSITARRLAGIVRLETGSGDLEVTDTDLSPGGLLRLRTFNGHIVLGLARSPADARILALTLNGTIRSDLPLSERPGFGATFREGVFGNGEPLISLDAVRGDITITARRR